jgi:hypothetical protein
MDTHQERMGASVNAWRRNEGQPGTHMETGGFFIERLNRMNTMDLEAETHKEEAAVES